MKKVHVTVVLYEAKQKHLEEQSANLTIDLDQIKDIKQLFTQLPCINDMCENLKSKLQSKSVMLLVHVVPQDEEYSLVCVSHLQIRKGLISVGENAMFLIFQNEWNDSTRLLCKMTTECYPKFGLFRGFVRTMMNKICPQQIIPDRMYIRITSINYHWILSFQDCDIFMIYDSQINLKSYKEFPERILKKSRFVKCPQQPNDDLSCGLHALMFLMFKTHGKLITPNCLKINDQYRMLHDLCCLLKGDNETTTDTLIENYYQDENESNETWNTYEVIKKNHTSIVIEALEGTQHESLQMLKDE